MKQMLPKTARLPRRLGRRVWVQVSGPIVGFGAVSAIVWAAMTAQPTPAKADTTATASVQSTGQTQKASAASTLPGGASSLQESYQNWRLACSQEGAEKHCSISQQQVDPKTNQRVLAVEITGSLDHAQGVIVLPFGLSLAAGVTLQVDDVASKTPMAFRTCLPIGCIVPLTIDAAGLEDWRKGTALKLVTLSDGGQETVFTVSLDGFSAAHNRLDSLGK